VAIPSILAIIFGHVALYQIRESQQQQQFGPPQGGRGLAIAGLVIGYLGLALTAVLVVAVLMDPNFASD
jgi:hypothetical protein